MEIAEHAASHLPFRDWCKHCIFGKAADWPHLSVTRTADGVPLVQVDYFFMNRKGDADIIGVLNCYDMPTGGLCLVETEKGPIDYTIKAVVRFLDDFLGRTTIRLRDDGEPAAGGFATAVQAHRTHETQLESSPRYSSGSLGAVERSNRTAEGQIRAMRSAKEERLKENLTTTIR